MLLQNIQLEFLESILSDILPAGMFSPEANLRIHQNNVYAGLLKTLQDTYPLLSKLLGADFFLIVAKDYIHQYPSRSANLHDYGAYFSDFLAGYPAVKTLTYLPEVAKFEWICHTLYIAADHPPLDTNALGHIAPEKLEQLHFSLHPASHLEHFYYPILRIIDLCKQDIDPEENIELNEGAIDLLIIRRDVDLILVPLSAGEFQFLTSLSNDESLGEALAAALRVDKQFNLEEKLTEWIKDKTIVDVICK